MGVSLEAEVGSRVMPAKRPAEEEAEAVRLAASLAVRLAVAAPAGARVAEEAEAHAGVVAPEAPEPKKVRICGPRNGSIPRRRNPGPGGWNTGGSRKSDALS